MTDITPIVKLLVELAALLVSMFLIPWIKTKVESQKLENIKKWVGIAVKAAEQIYRESGMGETKKKYVLDFLEKKGIILDLDVLDTIIENAVYEIQ